MQSQPKDTVTTTNCSKDEKSKTEADFSISTKNFTWRYVLDLQVHSSTKSLSKLAEKWHVSWVTNTADLNSKGQKSQGCIMLTQEIIPQLQYIAYVYSWQGKSTYENTNLNLAHGPGMP